MNATEDDVDPSDHSLLNSDTLKAIIAVIGIIGNGMVIVIIFKTKEMRNSTNIFLANLASADLMLLVWGTSAFQNIYGILIENTSAKIVCVVKFIAADALIYASALTILAISFERYYAVCQPLKAGFICTNNRAFRVCLLVWAIAVLFSSTDVTFWSHVPERHSNATYFEPYCRFFFSYLQKKVYKMTAAVVFFILPLIIMMVLYTKIAVNLKRAAASNVNIAAMRHHRRVVKLVAAVVLWFFICHLPFRVLTFILFIIADKSPNWLEGEAYSHPNLSKLMIFYVHPAANPILYNMMSSRFRASFKKIFYDTVHGCHKWRRCWSSGKESANIAVMPPNATSNV